MYSLIDNKTAQQYEFHIDGEIAKVEYKKKENKIYLIHTEVPKPLGGRGIASQLVKHVLEDIQEKGWYLVVYCPYVKSYLQRHPEWNDQLQSIDIRV